MRIYNGDCLEVMKHIPDGSIDMICTDPPYGISFKSSRQQHQKTIENDGLAEWEAMITPMLLEFKRILTDTGCCCCCCGGGGGKMPVTAILTMEVVKHFELIQTLVWLKTIGVGWRYRPSYENILVFAKDRDNYNWFDDSKNCSNVLVYNKVIPQKGDHPTVKPVDLMLKLIKIHTNEGMTVLDPFAGSFTTGVACQNLGRHFIGIEKDPGYYAIGKERMAMNRKLFDLTGF